MASISLSILLFSIFWLNLVDSIIFYQGHTTACDQCDRISTNSVRNILCCTTFSKCCLPNSLDEYNEQVKAEDDIYYGRRSKSNANNNRPSLASLINDEMNRRMKKKKKQSNTNNRKNDKKRKPTTTNNKKKRPTISASSL
ncbi:uncharacterized protein LOC113789336 [Dermatophagoides pteronyssinus]|uniref:uncharacterized protein LOC113789336 n=1 Tax=Dermatophagoides pteronyssinus TaxID=6956 RepID=UPI003F67C57A